jgi:hypothetical protein
MGSGIRVRPPSFANELCFDPVTKFCEALEFLMDFYLFEFVNL